MASVALNCCRICLAEGDDKLDVYINSEALSEIGHLYETAMDVKIDLSTWEYYPRFLCYDCEQTIRDFLKLKLKAQDTLHYLQTQLENYEDLIAEVVQEDDCTETYEPEALYTTETVDHKVALKERQSGSATKVCYADIYQEFVTETAQRSLLTDTAGNTTSAMEYVKLVSKSDVEGDENTFFISEEMYEKLKHDQNFDDNQFVVQETNADGNDESANVIIIDSTNSGSLAEQTDGLAQQLTNFDSEVSLACYTCSKEFVSRGEMLMHRKAYHDNKYPCAKCPKILKSSDALRVHSRLHSEMPLFSCELCGKTFNQKVHYKYHMNRHNNIRQFNCVHCGKSFLSKSDLRTHIRSHTGERPYFCKVCGKDFLILQHLKTHMYSHSNKSFECETCKQKFTSPVTLRQHRLAVHELEPRRFRCNLCDKRFRRKHHLLAHMRVHATTMKTHTPTATDNAKVEEKTINELLLSYDDLQANAIEEIAIVDVEHDSHVMVPAIYN